MWLFAACVSADPTNGEPTPGDNLPKGNAGTGNLRALHLGIGVGPTDVYLDDTKVAGPLGAMSGSSDVTGVSVGQHVVAFVPAGSGIGSAIASVAVDVTPNTRSTATLVGPAETPSVLLVDEPTADLPTEDARIQWVHGSPAHPQIGIWSLPEDGLLHTLSFAQAESIDVAAGAHTFELDHDGDGGTDHVYLVSGLTAGSFRNVYVTCTDDTPYLVHQDPSGAVTVTPPEAHAEVRVVHAAPNLPPLEIWLEPTGTGLFGAVPYGEVSPFVALPPGTYRLNGSAGPDAQGFDAMTVLAEHDQTTLIVWEQATMIVQDDQVGIPPGLVRLQVTAAAPDLETIHLVDTYSLEPLIADLSVGKTKRIDTFPGPYTLGLDDDDDDAYEATFEIPYLGTDRVVNMVVIRPDGVPKLLLVFPDQTTWTLSPEGWF